MDKIKKDIEAEIISKEVIPKNSDYKRGYGLYKLEGYIQPKYVPYDETLDSFNEESEIYRLGISLLRKYSLNPNEWTLLYKHDSDWVSTFKLIQL